jgi:hypothetical protein
VPNYVAKIHYIHVEEPELLTVSGISTNDNCFLSDGSVTTTVTGGVSPYSYSWNNFDDSANLTSVASGNYTVTVTDDNGCVATTSVSVSQNNPVITFNITTTEEICGLEDATATVGDAAGSVSPYTYMWSDGQETAQASNLGAGVYDVTVYDIFGCDASETITITGTIAVSFNTASSDATCGGSDGDATITVSAANGDASNYVYEWSDGQTDAVASNLTAGFYYATVTDEEGCASTNLVLVSTDVEPNVTITSTDVLCFGGATGSATVMADGTTSSYNFEWIGEGLVESGTTSTLAGLTIGNYTVEVEDLDGCVTFANVDVNQPAVVTANHF